MSYGVWMTKAELAAARRISTGSVNRLMRRKGWERQPGDDGRTRILVPRCWTEDTAPIDTPVAGAEARIASQPSEDGQRLQEMVGELREQIVRLRAEIEATRSARRQVELERDQERQGREAAECALNQARQQAEEAVEMAEALRRARDNPTAEERAERVTREAAAAQLRRLTEAMTARRSLSRWARLRLAWRGE